MGPIDEHPALDQLALYCEGDLGEYAEIALESHFASCPACVSVVERMNSLLYDGFTAESYAEELREQTAETDPLRAALRALLQQGVEHAATVARWIGNAAPWVPEAPLADFALFFTEERSTWLSAGPGGAGPSSSQPEALQVRLFEQDRSEIEVREPGQTVTILGPPERLALLFAIDGQGATQLVLLSGQDFGEARLMDVEPGRYGVALSPPE